MQPVKRNSIPVAALKNDLAVDDMKETTTAQTFRIFPLEHSPLTIFENIFRYTNHRRLCKALCKHLSNRFFTDHRIVNDLVVHGIVAIKVA